VATDPKRNALVKTHWMLLVRNWMRVSLADLENAKISIFLFLKFKIRKKICKYFN